MTDEDGRLGARLLDQILEPLDHGGSIQAAGRHPRPSVAGEIRDHYPMTAHEVRDDLSPLHPESAEPVQEHDRRTVPTLQQLGGHASEIDSALGDGDAFKELGERVRIARRAVIVAFVSHPAAPLCMCHLEPRIQVGISAHAIPLSVGTGRHDDEAARRPASGGIPRFTPALGE